MKSLTHGKTLGYLICLVIVISILLIVISFSIISYSAQSQLNSELKLDSQLGIPTTPEEMSRYVSVPDSENAGPIYKSSIFKNWVQEAPILQRTKSEATKSAVTQSKNQHTLPKVISPDQINHEADLLYATANQANLKKLPIALKKPYFSYPKNWSEPQNATFIELLYFKSVARVLYIQGKENAKSNPKLALKNLKDLVLMSNQLSGKSVMVTGLVHCAVYELSVMCGRAILTDNQNRLEIVTGVMDEIQKLKQPSTLQYASSETFNVVYFVSKVPKKEFLASFSTDGSSAPIWGHFAWSRNEAAATINQFCRGEIQLLKTYSNNFPTASKKMSESESKFENDHPDYPVDPQMFLDGLRVNTQMLRDQRILILACKVDLYRLKNQLIPKSLSKYGDLSVNPITDRPFLYQISGSSVKIYCQIPQTEPKQTGSKEHLERINLTFKN